MGTLYMNFISSYQQMADHIVKNTESKIIAKALVGSHFYLVYEGKTQDGKTHTCICLFLIKRYKGEYGYKAIGEEAMPYYYTCPERILKLSTQTCENSTLWRARCRETIRRKEEWAGFVAALVKDQVIKKQDGGELTFKFVIDNRNIACQTAEGKVFRYNFKDFDF